MENTTLAEKQNRIRCNLGDSVSTESTVEYTLPDYLPEIRRVLRLESRVIPSGQYLDGSRAEFAGIVMHTVLYADEEGHAAAVNVNSDYTVLFPYGGGEEVSAHVLTRVESTACRPSGPRKLSLRSLLKSNIELYQPTEVPHPEAEVPLERTERQVACMRVDYGEKKEFTLSDSVPAEGIAPDTVTPLFSDAAIVCRELRPTAEGVTLRGDAMLRCVLRTEDGRLLSFTRRIPFEEEAQLPGAEEADACRAYACCTSVAVSAVGDGKDGTLLQFDLNAECEPRAVKNETVSVTSDVYAPSCRSETVGGELNCVSHLASAVGCYTVSGSGNGAEERADRVVDTAAVATVRKISAEGGRVVILGDIQAKLLLAAAEEEGERSLATEYSYPFRIEPDLRTPIPDNVKYDCQIDVVCAHSRPEAAGYATDTELAVSLTVLEETTVPHIASVRTDPSESYAKDPATMIVTYPEDNETLWSVAKRYHTTPAALAAANQLAPQSNEEAAAPSSLDGVAYLLID